MTCKDCIHENLCVIKAFPDAFENTKWQKEPCDHFKDKSQYIELPCKVGDMLYDIYDAKLNGGSNIRELKVPEIHINLDRRNKPWIIISSYYFAFEDFGKYTFFTKEEAEKALKESDSK